MPEPLTRVEPHWAAACSTTNCRRMKTGIEHRGPLSDATLDVLESVRPLSDMTLMKLLRDVGLADRATVHGFRTSFRTRASERTGVPHAVYEESGPAAGRRGRRGLLRRGRPSSPRVRPALR